MLDSLTNWFGSLASSRSRSLSVPVFDGAFKPNNLLEEADIFSEAASMRDLAIDSDGKLHVAKENGIYTIDETGAQTKKLSFDSPVSALTFVDGHQLCVALGDRIVIAADSDEERCVGTAVGRKFTAITALAPAIDGGLLVCDGSNSYACEDWAIDLMSKNKSGRLVRLGTGDDTGQELATGLAYAFGAYESAETGTLVSESWAHSVNQLNGGKVTSMFSRLPGYPCRFTSAGDGGFWLSLFCSRTQLVEFVLKENDYRRDMMATIDPRHWICPSFGSGEDFLEPLQGGGVKQMGVLKPWAPPRSYGLLVRYDCDLMPRYSLHSRVGGRNHGICAAVQKDDTLYALSRGSGRILKLSVSAVEAELLGRNAA